MEVVHIPFKSWDLIAWVNEQSGEAMIAVKPIAEAIGVQPARQSQKIQADPRYRWAHMCVPSAGGPQEMLCLPVKQVNGWLYGINANKVKPEIREKLLQFQEDCHMALHDAITGRASRATVEVLHKMIEELRGVVQQQGETINALAATVNSMHQQDDLAVSYAGRVLNTRRGRHLRVV